MPFPSRQRGLPSTMPSTSDGGHRLALELDR